MEFEENQQPQHNHSHAIKPDKAAESGQIQEHIQKALEHLSGKERSVFVLRHYQDLPLKEIAGVLQISIGSVKSLLFRAIKKMQAAVCSNTRVI